MRFVLSCIFAVASFGCGTATTTGGGHIDSATGEGKANFGFNFHCDAETGDVKGHIQYSDKNAGIRLTGSPLAASCADDINTVLWVSGYWGTYQAKDTDKGRGYFYVRAIDGGRRGGDTIAVTLYGGPYNGYHNFDSLDGGNIKFH